MTIHATLLGRLGRDSELRYTPEGTAVLGFAVATDSGFGDKKITHWIDCALWGKQAERLAPHLLKGANVMLIGELSTKEFQKRDGAQGFGLTLRVDKLEFAGAKKDSEGGQGTPQQTAQQPRHAPQQAPINDFDPDDIPF